MKPFKHTSGKWAVQFPVKYGKDGKREMRYYKTRDDALEGIKDVTREQNEHGRSGVTALQREWINFAEKQLGDLALLPEVIRHWKRTGEKLNQTAVKDAVKEFQDSAEKDYPNHRTLNDIKERLENFKEAFSSRLVHEVSPTDIERFLEGYSAGWDRWSYHKRLGRFFKMAKRRRWIAMNPMEEVPKPKTPTPDRGIYTAEQFHYLLQKAELEKEYLPLVPYIVLSGFCFVRTAELIRMYETERVLRWEHVMWDDNLIHVPPGVAKSTRRESGDERYIPLNDAAKAWLKPIQKTEGDCVEHSASKFGQLWRKMTNESKIPRIDNGLRHSAISYSLAAHPEHGVALTSQWAGNSEKTIRKHYRRLLKPEQGKAWFEVRPTFL